MGRARAAATSFWRKAYEDNLTGLSGMVAYNLLLSIFPLALVALFVAGRVLRSQELQDSVLLDLERVFPTAAESTLSEAVRRLQQSSTTTGILALVAAVWFASSFWGALDTAFCRIYHRPCRSWIRQKLFALGMFAVVLLFIAASVAVPALQSVIATGASDLPFGLSDVRNLVYWVTLALGVVVLFGALCLTYQLVPRGTIPWRCVWPGALGATVAMGIVDYGFPLYLQNVSALRAGTTFVFVLIALVWFYALALILLAGAVVNELRFERLDREGGSDSSAGTLAAMPDPKTEEMQLEQLQRERSERGQAGEAAEPAEEKAHDRRAERAAYLRDKLADRARSEDEADG